MREEERFHAQELQPWLGQHIIFGVWVVDYFALGCEVVFCGHLVPLQLYDFIKTAFQQQLITSVEGERKRGGKFHRTENSA